MYGVIEGEAHCVGVMTSPIVRSGYGMRVWRGEVTGDELVLEER